MREFLEDLRAMSWQDRLTTLALVIGLAPLWIPFYLVAVLSLHWRLWRCLHGDTETAWRRCTAVWGASGIVFGSAVGANLDTPFAHSLAELFARRHPDSREFLVRQLSNSDPYLAAYAFKCLIRFPGLTLADIPADVLNRAEPIRKMDGGCFVDTVPLGQYVRTYFHTEQYRQQAGGLDQPAGSG
jgi:hypothetical protein